MSSLQPKWRIAARRPRMCSGRNTTGLTRCPPSPLGGQLEDWGLGGGSAKTGGGSAKTGDLGASPPPHRAESESRSSLLWCSPSHPRLFAPPCFCFCFCFCCFFFFAADFTVAALALDGARACDSIAGGERWLKRLVCSAVERRAGDAGRDAGVAALPLLLPLPLTAEVDVGGAHDAANRRCRRSKRARSRAALRPPMRRLNAPSCDSESDGRAIARRRSLSLRRSISACGCWVGTSGEASEGKKRKKERRKKGPRKK